MIRNDMAHVWRVPQILPFKTVRAEVGCIFCFISREVLPSLGRVPSEVRCAPAQRVAEDGLTKARPPRRPWHKRVIFSQSLNGPLLHVARLESTRTFFLFQLRTGEPDNRIHPANL